MCLVDPGDHRAAMERAEMREEDLDGELAEATTNLKDASLLIIKLIRGRDDELAQRARRWLLDKKLMPNPLRSEHEDP